MVTRRVVDPVLQVPCPDCEGDGIREIAGRCRSCDDWDTFCVRCERCDGSGKLPAVVCIGCDKPTPADEIEPHGYCQDCIAPEDEELCPECGGDGEIERIKGPPNRDGGVTEWNECELCNGSGMVPHVDL